MSTSRRQRMNRETGIGIHGTASSAARVSAWMFSCGGRSRRYQKRDCVAKSLLTLDKCRGAAAAALVSPICQ